MVSAKDYGLWDEQMSNVLREDHDVYVHQQRAIDDNPAANGDVMAGGGLQGDQGLYRMRRILDRLYQAGLAALQEQYIWTASVDGNAVRLKGFFPFSFSSYLRIFKGC